jgi:hypothetical protein
MLVCVRPTNLVGPVPVIGVSVMEQVWARVHLIAQRALVILIMNKIDIKKMWF